MKLTEQQKDWLREVYIPRGKGHRKGAGEHSQADLAELLGVSIPTVRKALKETGPVSSPEPVSPTIPSGGQGEFKVFPGHSRITETYTY